MNKLFSILCFVVFGMMLSFCHQNGQEKKQTTQQVKDTSKAKLTELPPPVETEVPSRVDLQNQIKAMEKELFASEQLDVNKARAMIRLYDTYHKNYYKDFVCPDYLFKAGEISENINQFNRAAQFYGMCCTEYNDNFKYRAECLFRLANVYDYRLNDYVRAKHTYTQVIEQYPKTQLARDAAAAIKMMGRSDQDMVRSFERQNAGKK